MSFSHRFPFPRGLALAAVLLAMAPHGTAAQALPVGDPLEEYVRILGLLGKAEPSWVNVRPAPLWRGLPVGDTVSHPWQNRFGPARPLTDSTGVRASLDPARLRVFLNSSYPYGQNDGAVWQGKGLTSALDVGGTLAWKHLTVSVRPTLIFNQNGDFPLATVTREGATVYADPWRRMDLPQRFGPKSYWTLDPGQSMVRLIWRAVSVGFGTENMWWGPGVENAILMSDNAPGFPHAVLATAHPVNIGIGTIQAQWIWGRLQQSQWADTIPARWLDSLSLSTKRYITGAVGSFRPRGLPGITFGGARVFTESVPQGGLGAREYLLLFNGLLKTHFITAANPTGQDARDEILSLFGRWAKPGSGFEVYTEWARNDHAYNFRHALLEPEHSQGYTLGFRQVVPLSGNRLLAWRGELTHLEKPSTMLVLDYGTYYEHWAVPAGYTQLGQVLGAAVGPGGDGQYAGVDVFAPWGRAGAFVRRQVRDNDAYWRMAVQDSLGACCHDVVVSVGARSLWFLDHVDLGVDATVNRELNRYYIEDNDHWNLNLAVSVREHRRGGSPRR